MISKLEDTLLRLRSNKRESFRGKLFDYLDDGISLLRLRSVSRALCNIIGHLPIEMLFSHMYIRAPPQQPEAMTFFASIAPHCQSLTITIGDPNIVPMRRSSRPSSQITRHSQEFVQSLLDRLNQVGQSDSPTRRDSRNSMASLRQSLTSMISGANGPRVPISPLQPSFGEQQLQDEAQERWFDALSRFQNLSSLTLRVYGDSNWPGRREIEQTLIDIRLAIEHANLPALQTFNVTPVHAMGIIHLRWDGLKAFAESFASSAEVWQRITTLDLRINNPSALTKARRTMFLKSLYGYLSSFSDSLQCLRFVWIGAEGPSPLAIHREPELIEEARSPIHWEELRELWLGNFSNPYRTTLLIPDLAPEVEVIKYLRPIHRDSVAVTAGDPAAWLDVELAQTMGRNSTLNRSSSLYSRQSARYSPPWAGGISRSSKDMEDYFVLDVDQ